MVKYEKTLEQYRIEMGISQRDFAESLDQPLNTYIYQAKTNNHALSIIDKFCRKYSISKQNIDMQRKEKK